MPPATLVAGRYLLVDMLGRGGMGAVWRAQDQLLGREVALKEVAPPPGVDPGPLYARVIREARSAARLDHPGIVTVYDVVEDDGRPWIVMRLVPADSLDRVLRDRGPLPPAEVAAIGAQLLDALRLAHAAGVVHRDVKPGNVMLLPGNRAVLTDFGIASLAGDPELTRQGALLGSPAYLAPEQARRQPATPLSDLWSLGATLYAAVEGRPPYQAADVLGVLAALLEREPDPPRRAGVLLPVLAGLLRKDPQQRIRPADAAHLLETAAAAPAATAPSGGIPAQTPAAQGWTTAFGASGTHPGASDPATVTGTPRNRRAWIAGAAVAAVLAAGTGVGIVLLNQDDGEGGPGTAATDSGAPSAPASAPASTPAGTPAGTGGNAPLAGEKEYKGPLFTAVVPEGWQIDTSGDFTAKTTKEGANEGLAATRIAGGPLDALFNTDPKKALQELGDDVAGADSKLVGQVAELYFQGDTAAEAEYTFTKDGKPGHLRLRLSRFGRSDYMMLMLITDEALWQEGQRPWQRFTETFRPAS